ncbi:MAG: hypothetical protein WAN11_01660 [Syntrophobacteraceae bacterium]
MKNADQIHRKLIDRATDDPFFVGWALAKYLHIQAINLADLAHRLKCTPEGIDRIALCRLPDNMKENFASDVQKIAAFGPCNREALLHVIRTVMSVHVMQETAGDSLEGFLMVARDHLKAGTDNSPISPKEKKDDLS